MQVQLGEHPKETSMEDSKPFLVTYEEAARLLACSARTIRRLIVAGLLEEVRLTRDAPRLRLSEVEGLAAQNRPTNSEGETR